MSSLLVVAHPDDEILYFGGLLLGAGKKTWPSTNNFTVVLVTNANADKKGAARIRQFHRCMKSLKIKNFLTLNFPDEFNKRLDTQQLIATLKHITHRRVPDLIFTHGCVGEYGHPHHQDVSYAVHQAFKKHPNVWSVAQHAYPKINLLLSENIFSEKGRILNEIYGKETIRFQNLIPNSNIESFHQVSALESERLYQYLTGKTPSLKTKTYHDYLPYLKQLGPGKKMRRLF